MTIDILSDAQKEAGNALNAVALNIAAGGTKMKAQIQHAEMLSGIAKALLSVAKNDDEEKLGELSLELTKRDKHIAVSGNLLCATLNILLETQIISESDILALIEAHQRHDELAKDLQTIIAYRQNPEYKKLKSIGIFATIFANITAQRALAQAKKA